MDFSDLNFGEKIFLLFFVLIGLIIGTIVLFPFVCWSGCVQNYSDGQRSGDVYKFSKKGLFWKSWEGEMYLGGYHSTGGKNPTIETDKFYFSIPESQEVEKKDIIEKLKTCVEKRETCSIEYNEWFYEPMNVSSGYIVAGVK